MASIVFDASVILAHLNGEPGADRAAAHLGDAIMCAVNLSEIVAKLVERGASLALIRPALSRYGLQIVPFDEDLAERAGALRAKHEIFRAFARRPGLPRFGGAIPPARADRGSRLERSRPSHRSADLAVRDLSAFV